MFVLNLYEMRARSSLAFTIFLARPCLYSAKRAAMRSSVSDSICTARIAALRPALMPTVATGMPGGICTIASRASIPSSVDLMGTPITGTVVWAAITPGRCAAMPAAAIITFSPRLLALLAKSVTSCGVRCAERALISNGISNSSSSLAAFSSTGMSDVLPIMMLTIGFIYVLVC